jgi:hypothetical protein
MRLQGDRQRPPRMGGVAACGRQKLFVLRVSQRRKIKDFLEKCCKVWHVSCSYRLQPNSFREGEEEKAQKHISGGSRG